MFHQEGNGYSGRSEPPWRPPAPSTAPVPAAAPWLRRLQTDMHRVLQNEVETRRFLAREVYRVPENWLDDVIRVRMTDLFRD